MSTLATALKQEIARVARKEVRKTVQPVLEANARLRTQVATLKQRLGAMESKVRTAARAAAAVAPTGAESSPAPAVLRWSGPRFKRMRERLDITIAETAFLLGVSSQSVTGYETKGVRPRPKVMERIAYLRKLSKRQVADVLAQLRARRQAA